MRDRFGQAFRSLAVHGIAPLSLSLLFSVSAAAAAAAAAEGVPIRILLPTFGCRDMSDMIRLGLRRVDHDKPGFLAFYFARQATGACEAVREGSIALLQDVHDEQGLHLVCLRQSQDAACIWTDGPRFTSAP